MGFIKATMWLISEYANRAATPVFSGYPRPQTRSASGRGGLGIKYRPILIARDKLLQIGDDSLQQRMANSSDVH